MPKTLKLPKQDELKEHFTYYPDTGSFLRYDGYFGCIRPDGYWYINYGGTQYMAHRLIWKYMTGEEPNEIDHINRDRSDNSWDNLRSVTHKQNSRNQKKRVTNTSGFNGVSFDKNRNVWIAETWVEKKIIIGAYDTPEEAAKAREEFLQEFHPNHFSVTHGT